jgi:hypothetical protein
MPSPYLSGLLGRSEADYTDEELGIAPLGLDTTSEALGPQSGLQRLLGGFAGYEDVPQRAPRGFAEGLVGGFGQGLGRAATRAQTERQKQEQGIRERQAARDKANLSATESYRDRRAKAFQELNKTKAEKRKEEREAKEAADKLDLEQPVVDAALKVKYPALAGLPDGQRLAKGVIEEVQKRALPEKPETPAEKRANAAAEMRARTETRQMLAAEVANLSKLSDQAEADPDIKSFPTIRDSYETGNEAAGRKNSAGDIILMRMIAKATDPTTGVREEEFRTFEGAQGALAHYGVRLTSAMWGKGQLNEPGREQLRGILQGIYDRKLGYYNAAKKFHVDRAQGLGVEGSRIVRDYAPAAPPAPPAATRIRYDISGNRVP